MSYTIVYDKVCVALGNGTFIPMVLAGSNNVWVKPAFGGRSKRDRDWYPIYTVQNGEHKFFAFTKPDLLYYARSRRNEEEIFMENGKYIKGPDFEDWMQKLINKALLLEDLVEANNNLLSLNFDFKDEFSNVIFGMKASSSNDIIKMLAEYQEYFTPTSNSSTILRFNAEKIKKSIPKPSAGKVAGRYKGKNPAWIKEYEKNVRVTRTNNPEEAILFDSEEDMWNKIGDVFKYTITPVSEQSLKNNMIERNYVIRVDCSGYFSKLSSKSLFYTPYEGNAKKFTEKEAQKKVEEIQARGYKSLLKIVCLSSEE
jgi:hypothetical protein